MTKEIESIPEDVFQARSAIIRNILSATSKDVSGAKAEEGELKAGLMAMKDKVSWCRGADCVTWER